MGRPKTGRAKGVIVAVRVRPELKDALTDLAHDHCEKMRAMGVEKNVTESDVVRWLIEQAAAPFLAKPPRKAVSRCADKSTDCVADSP